mmetsp:Transcript_25789/g.71043  ORF Transcript_25789/g.71043 Transcript_25789/m.71043 type:complete len:120 (-) Transcript_25789:88-447(-)
MELNQNQTMAQAETLTMAFSVAASRKTVTKLPPMNWLQSIQKKNSDEMTTTSFAGCKNPGNNAHVPPTTPQHGVDLTQEAVTHEKKQSQKYQAMVPGTVANHDQGEASNHFFITIPTEP